MKKLISYVLLLALTLSLFAGCALVPTEDPTGPVNESYLDSAKNILYQKYKPASKDEIPEKKRDFELMTNIVVGGANHTVVWTIEVTSGDASAIKLVAGTNADYAQIVDVPDEPTEDILYTLTATISDYAGETVTISFKFKTPAYSYDNLPTVKAPVVGTAYKLGLIQVNLKKALYLDGTCGERYLNTTEDKAKSPDAYVEEAEGGFKIYIMVDGAKKYIEYIAKDLDPNDEKVDMKDCAQLGDTGNVFFFDNNNCTWTTTISVKDDGTAENRSLVAYNNYNTVGASWSGHTTADNIGITQFPLGFFPVDSVEVPNIPESTDPEADTTLTIPAAVELGLSKVSGAYTSGKYYVIGEITEVYNTTYGNMKIKDDAGNILTIYGSYSADGKTRYDKLETKPVAGDTVKVYGVIGQFNGTAQMQNGWIVEHTPATGDNTGDDNTGDEIGTLTIPEANTLGQAQAHNTYTTEKYYIEGIITEVYNTSYGNMYIKDENGNTFTVYGLYLNGTRYDAMTTKPAAGDKIKVCGTVGQYNGTAQTKNAELVELEVLHTHTYSTATCTVAPTCACGLTNGTALGHADANTDHVCDNGCGVAQGTHADGDDEDLLCDYGCGATIDSNAPVVNKVVFDFEKANSNYGAYTSASGWVIANGCVQAGGTSDSNPYFKAIGADNTTQAVCLNGKNSAIGKLTSPTLTGGISKLTFNYGIMFSDSKVGVTIKITDANGVSQTTTLSDTTMTKFAVETFTWTLETAVTGSFTIEITNTCPSNSTSNKDRISIWNIQYEG